MAGRDPPAPPSLQSAQTGSLDGPRWSCVAKRMEVSARVDPGFPEPVRPGAAALPDEAHSHGSLNDTILVSIEEWPPAPRIRAVASGGRRFDAIPVATDNAGAIHGAACGGVHQISCGRSFAPTSGRRKVACVAREVERSGELALGDRERS